MQPSTFSSALAAGDVVGNELLVICAISREGFDAQSFVEREIENVKKHLEWLRPSEQTLQDALDSELRGLIAQRKQILARHSNVLESLGIPIRQSAAPVPASAAPVVRHAVAQLKTPTPVYEWDVFISHATEDKETFARPLAQALKDRGLRVWFDEFTLRVGDSLRESIDHGLGKSRYGIVVLSKAFFDRHWTTQELNGLASRESRGKKVILPVWFGVGRDDVQHYSPILADRLAARYDRDLDDVIAQLLAAINQQD